MTEMVFGSTRVRSGDAILPRWWRTLDKWTLACVVGLFAIGILLGLAASVPLAEKNGLPRFYYVNRQGIFGGVALVVMLVISMMSPRQVRRLGVVIFAVAFLTVVALPVIGTDGELSFRFGGMLKVDGDLDGAFRGDVDILVEYL